MADGGALVDSEHDGGIAICHSGTWSAPQPLTGINTTSHESDPTFSDDGREVFYTSNRTPTAGYGVWRATRATTLEAFSDADLVIELDTAADDQDPSLSTDGLTLYFSSDRSGSEGIYVATRPSRGALFESILPLAIVGDASPVQRSPAISRDGLTLYYSRDLDLAYAQRASFTEPFAFVRELDEVNVPSTDGNIAVTADELELFFESYRTGTAAMFTATRATTAETWSPPVEIPSLVIDVTGGSAAGGPEISADGRTLSMFVNVGGQIDVFASTRSCD